MYSLISYPKANTLHPTLCLLFGRPFSLMKQYFSNFKVYLLKSHLSGPKRVISYFSVPWIIVSFHVHRCSFGPCIFCLKKHSPLLSLMKQCFPDVIAELLLEQTFHAYVCPESVVFPFFSDVGLHNAKWRILKDTVERQADRQTERQRETDRQAGRQAGRQRQRQSI